VGSDLTEFFYTLKQAPEHRAGLVAQRRLQEVKADFYSMVTHDLRGPAGSILIAARMLRDGEAGPLTPDQVELFDIIHQAAEKMTRLGERLPSSQGGLGGVLPPSQGGVGGVLPLLRLSELLGTPDGTSQPRHALVVRRDGQPVGLCVDEVLGHEEIVVKPLPAALQGTPGLARVTIMGEGQVVLILDVMGL